jgi:hypothetical protein
MRDRRNTCDLCTSRRRMRLKKSYMILAVCSKELYETAMESLCGKQPNELGDRALLTFFNSIDHAHLR